MREPVSRRGVVIGIIGTACVAVSGALPAWHSLSDAGDAVRAMIQDHLKGAAIEAGAIDSFVADFLAAHRIEPDGVAIGNVCDALGLDDIAEICINNGQYLHRVEGRVIDLFVRSTDLLTPDRDRGGPIRYLAYWNPYSGACRNPLADLTQGA